MSFENTKIIELGSCAFRQWRASSHCKFIHGYRLTAKFWFCCSELDEKNWVVDFGGLKELKNILEHQFDHTLCISADDPLLPQFKQLDSLGGCDLRIMPDGVGIERSAEWCFFTADKFVRQMTGDRCWVSKVEVWEHDKNSALYVRNSSCCKDKLIQKLENTENKVVVTPEPLPEPQPVQNSDNAPRPAPIGNKVSTGWSNPFAGTSWGV